MSDLKVELAKPTPFTRVLCIHPDDVGPIMKSGIFNDPVIVYHNPHKIADLITSGKPFEPIPGSTVILSPVSLWNTLDVLSEYPVSWLIIVPRSQRKPKRYARLIIKRTKDLMGDMRIFISDQRDSDDTVKIEDTSLPNARSLSGKKKSMLNLSNEDMTLALLGSSEARQKWVDHAFINMLDAFHSSDYLDKMLDVLDLIRLLEKYPSINMPDKYFVNKHALKNAFDKRPLLEQRVNCRFAEVLECREAWHKNNTLIRRTRSQFIKYMSTGDLFI